MPIPGDLTTVTVTGTFSSASGQPIVGTVTFTPSQTLLDPTSQQVIPAAGSSYPLSSMGQFTSDPLICTDNEDLEPQGWAYNVKVELQDLQPYTFTTFLPSSPSTVDLSALEPVSVTVGGTTFPVTAPGSYLPTGGGTETGVVVFDASPPFRIVGATSGQILVSDPSGNFYPSANTAGAATSIDGVTVTGITAAGRTIIATDSANATWQLPTQLDTADGDIKALAASGSAGSMGMGQSAKADHVHPSAGLVDTSTTQSIGGAKTFTGATAFSSFPALPSSPPSNPTDAATKAYVDASAAGLSVKLTVQAATTAALSPANTYSNGSSGVGATLTATGNGTLTVDGHLVALNDRILVKNESTAANQGIYLCTTAGTGSVPYVLTRSTDMDTAAQVPGAFTFVVAGTANVGNSFTVATGGPYTMGTTAIVFTLFSTPIAISAGNTGVTVTGSAVSLAVPVTIADGGTNAITAPAALASLGGAAVAGDLGGTSASPAVTAIQGTAVAAPTGGATSFLSAAGSWLAPSGSPGAHNMPVLNVVADYGANNAGGADAEPAISNAITAAIAAGGGIVYFPAGIYRVNSTLTCHTTMPVYFQGAGRWLTTILYYGSGDCLRVYDDTTYGGRASSGLPGGGGITGLTIDGTHHTGTGAAGLHMGDIFQYRADISVQNFSASGDIGVHFDNQYYWTEQLHGSLYAQNCAAGVVFDVSGATTSTGSYARIDMEIDIDQRTAAFDGVVLQNGAFLYDGRLSVRGNFGSSASPLTSAVLRLTGQLPAGHPGAGGYSLMFSMRLDVQVECTSTNTYRPQTIVAGVPGANFIRGATGVLDFAGAGTNFTQSNLATGGALVPGAIWFHGPVYGDGSLNPATSGSSTSTPIITLGPTLHNRGAASYFGSIMEIYTKEGDYFLPGPLTQNTTISLSPSGITLGAAQRLTIVLTQAASGGPYTVTWPVNSSPTTASPAVVWAGGVSPVMSTAANAVDVYVLETINGRTWYGYAIQATGYGTAASSAGSLTLGTAMQNTLGYGTTFNVCLSITANTSLVVHSGIGPTTTPTQQTIITGTTATGIVPLSFYVPASYYLLLSTTGTGTVSVMGVQAQPA